MPLLKTKTMKRAIARGLKDVIKNSKWKHTYDVNEFPINYPCLGDSHATYYDHMQENILSDLRAKGVEIPPGPNEHDDIYESNNFDEDCNEHWKQLELIIEPYKKEYMENDYAAYVPHHACHWWNPTFGLTLAKLIHPEIKWKVFMGEWHTTVWGIIPGGEMHFDIMMYDPAKDDLGVSEIHEYMLRI